MSAVLGTDRLICAVEVAYSLGSQEAVLRMYDGRITKVPAASVGVLLRCAGAKTADEHALTIQRDLGLHPQRLGEVRQVIGDLAASGALRRVGELWPSPPPERGAHSRISTLVVPTCDRPGALERCLRSFGENARVQGRTLDVVIGDDSRDADARLALRRNLRALSRELGVRVRYAGADEKHAFVGELSSASGVAPDVVDFALRGADLPVERMGANRNALLLDAIDERCISVDDDTVCWITRHPEMREEPTFADEGDPTEFWFYPCRDEALGAATFGAYDFFGIHESLLSRRLTNLAGHPQASLGGAGKDVTRMLVRGEGRVAVTYNGVIGDSGMYSGANLLHLGGATRTRLTRSDRDYDTAFGSREVLRVVAAPTVCRGIPFMGTFFGLDATGPLPPFMPVCRNEDGVFGYTLLKCLANACLGHVPYALLHDPEGARRYVPDRFGEIETFRLSDLVIQSTALAPVPCAFGDWRSTMESVGRSLSTVAGQALSTFEAFVRDRMCRHAGARAEMFERLLATHGSRPQRWADDVSRRLRTLAQRLTEDDYFVPADVEGPTLPERLERTRRLVGSWGQLLEAWPSLLDAARSLKSEGRTVSQPA